LFSNGLLESLRIFWFDALPSFFHLNIFDLILHDWWVCCLRFEGCKWCHHTELVALESLTVMRVRMSRRIEYKVNPLDILIGLCRYGLNRRPEVIDHIVVSDYVRDVLRLIDNLDVSLWWFDIPGVVRFPPMGIADKCVGGRSDAIIRVGP
jgi:hypothetical protein